MGMSSDESSVESGLKVFRIKKKAWRAAELGPFLHAIDRVAENRKNAITSRGYVRGLRLPGENRSQGRGVVTSLPINFYDQAFLANLRATARPAYDMLKIDPEAHPLVHHPVIQT